MWEVHDESKRSAGKDVMFNIYAITILTKRPDPNFIIFGQNYVSIMKMRHLTHLKSFSFGLSGSVHKIDILSASIQYH